jgi:hypothetical protein
VARREADNAADTPFSLRDKNAPRYRLATEVDRAAAPRNRCRKQTFGNKKGFARRRRGYFRGTDSNWDRRAGRIAAQEVRSGLAMAARSDEAILKPIPL